MAVLAGVPALASSPGDSGDLMPSGNGPVSAGWSGTLGGTAVVSDRCTSPDPGMATDHHTFTLSVPSDFYTATRCPWS